MPVREIHLDHQLRHLSILDESGQADPDLEPDLSADFLLQLHRTMLKARRFDERMLALQRQGRIGTFAPIKGQEASQLGAVAALTADDWMVPCFREMAAQLWRGAPLENFLLYYGGREEGVDIAPDQFDLPVAIPVASQLLHAVGLAWAIRYREADQVVMTFFGDGATSEGDFHEALNFAAVYQVPVIFVCQNNQWAISTPRNRQTRAATLAQKAIAYQMPGIQVDGNDILAVYAAAAEAVERARAGGGPTLIECITYRMSVHTTADDPKRYRSEEEGREWERRDPLARLQQYLAVKGILEAERIEELEASTSKEIEEAVKRAEAVLKQPPDPLDMFEHLYAEMPASLREQRQAFISEGKLGREEANHG